MAAITAGKRNVLISYLVRSRLGLVLKQISGPRTGNVIYPQVALFFLQPFMQFHRGGSDISSCCFK